MSGQVQIRDKATAWADHYSVPRGASYRGAVPAAVSLDTAVATPPRKKGAGKHRAVRSATDSAIKRALARSLAVLAPRPAIPAGAGASGRNSNSADPTVHGTAPIRPAEIAARHDHTSGVRWLHSYSGSSTPVDALTATGAARAVAARHDYVSDSGHSVYGAEPSRVQHDQATPLDDAALARRELCAVPTRVTASTPAAHSTAQPRAAELQWRAEWLESRQAQVQKRPSSDQVIVRQNTVVPSEMGW